ncbi:MAG: TIGR01777 family oxidoreductase [Acidimicrobiales bacterium]
MSMRVVIAGGTGSLGRRLADYFGNGGHDVTILTRSPRPDVTHRQVRWDGRTVGPWACELEGAVLINLAGEVVDRRPTAANVALLRRSRVEPTRALANAAAGLEVRPALWLQMSTTAIYGDAGQEVVEEGHPPAAGPPQMPGVARPWEEAAMGANAERLVFLRTGLVLDRGTPAFERLRRITRAGLGGRIGDGRQWVSWIHVDDFLRAVAFLCDHELAGIVHVCAPNPIQNGDMMAALRGALHRPWSPPTPVPLVRVGAFAMGSDAALALLGRRCVPRRLLNAEFGFQYPRFEDAVHALVAGAAGAQPSPAPSPTRALSFAAPGTPAQEEVGQVVPTGGTTRLAK